MSSSLPKLVERLQGTPGAQVFEPRCLRLAARFGTVMLGFAIGMFGC